MTRTRLQLFALTFVAVALPAGAARAGGVCDLILAPESGATGVPTNTRLMAGFLAFEAYLYDALGNDAPLDAETHDAVVLYTPQAPLAPNTVYYFNVMAGAQGGPEISFTTGAGPDTAAPTASPVVLELYGNEGPDVPRRDPGTLGVRLAAPVTPGSTIALYVAPAGQAIDTSAPYMFGVGAEVVLVSGCSYAFPESGALDVAVAELAPNGMPGPVVAAGTIDLSAKGCAVAAPGRRAGRAGGAAALALLAGLAAWTRLRRRGTIRPGGAT